MDLIPILYSHKIIHFNISVDLNFITFNASSLFVGDLINQNIYEINKGNFSYKSTFSYDNSILAAKTDHDIFRIFDNFQSKTKIRNIHKESSYGFEKPLMYEKSLFYFYTDFTKGYEGTYVYQHIDNKNICLFVIKNCFLRDNKIYENVLYASFLSYKRDKLCIYRRDLMTNQHSLIEYPIEPIYEYNSIIIPQKNLIVLLCENNSNIKHNVLLQYYQLDTFELLHTQEIISLPVLQVIPVTVKIKDMCNGNYIVIAHSRKGLIIINTDNYSIEKEASFSMVNNLSICDNDNFCCAYSDSDMVVFTPIDTPQNIELIDRIDNFLQKNGLGKLNTKI